jgi:hypothetical protein
VAARRVGLVVALGIWLSLPAAAPAAFAGANGKIAFVSDRDHNYEIYVANADGSNPVDVTNNPDTDQYPAWSPDGRQIAITSFRDGREDVYVMTADGSGQTRLTGGGLTSSSLDARPSWSPDGQQIVFYSNRSGGPYQLWLVNADGSSLRRLGDGWATDPAWSPDGTKIAYVSLDPSLPGQNFVYVMNADGSGGHRLTTRTSSEDSPSWSPDGSQIAFGAYFDWPASNAHGVFVVNADGSGLRQLTDGSGHAGSPAWSPDATKILFEQYDGALGFAGLYTISSDGSAQAKLVGGYSNNLLPDWAPSTADRSAPQITLTTPAQGAVYSVGERVAADYSCADEAGGSALAQCFGSYHAGTPIDTSSVGTKTFFVTAVDNAGNTATVTHTYMVADTAPPQIVIQTPAEGVSYTLGQSVLADYACLDEQGGSGLQFCSAPVPQDAPIDTASVGSKSFVVSGGDRAGNIATASHSYRVTYAFSGFAAPLTNATIAAPFKAGEGVPAKFSLSGNQGLAILAPGSPTSQPASCSQGTPLGDPTPTTGTLSYNTSLDRYTSLWSSDRTWAGSCRLLVLTLRDGTEHRALAQFTK